MVLSQHAMHVLLYVQSAHVCLPAGAHVSTHRGLAPWFAILVLLLCKRRPSPCCCLRQSRLSIAQQALQKLIMVPLVLCVAAFVIAVEISGFIEKIL